MASWRRSTGPLSEPRLRSVSQPSRTSISYLADRTASRRPPTPRTANTWYQPGSWRKARNPARPAAAKTRSRISDPRRTRTTTGPAALAPPGSGGGWSIAVSARRDPLRSRRAWPPQLAGQRLPHGAFPGNAVGHDVGLQRGQELAPLAGPGAVEREPDHRASLVTQHHAPARGGDVGELAQIDRPAGPGKVAERQPSALHLDLERGRPCSSREEPAEAESREGSRESGNAEEDQE